MVQNDDDPQDINPDNEELLLLGNEFKLLGFSIIGKSSTGSINTQFRRFKSHFGIDWFLCAKLWVLLIPILYDQSHPKGAKTKHLLWTLMFLRLYDTEEILSGKVTADEKTYRKWVWIFIGYIYYLQVDFVSCFYFILFLCHFYLPIY